MPKKEMDAMLKQAGERFDKFSADGSLLHQIVTAGQAGGVDSYERGDFLARVDREAKSGAKTLKQAIDTCA